MSDPVSKTTRWPATTAEWRRLKLAFAGWLHAIADRIEMSDHRGIPTADRKWNKSDGY